MNAIVIIPARYASTRYPGKPLAVLRGPDGVEKPLIQRSWEAALAVPNIASVHVATDSPEIRDVAERFGADVVMTSSECANGTERCAEALGAIGSSPDIVVNFQGDAPLTPAHAVSGLLAAFSATPDIEVATPVMQAGGTTYRRLLADEQQGRVGATCAVFDSAGRALYFSKKLIPYLPAAMAAGAQVPVFLHLGIYAYRPSALRRYLAAGTCELEQLEGLEQLRFLYAGIPVSVVPVSPPPWDLWELNNPSDLEPIEAALRQMARA
jgi:3-deoxy-manno-octulosonate cytidylyltransferase (CMP-KDO synthetase)